jgi:hypothetical protein
VKESWTLLLHLLTTGDRPIPTEIAGFRDRPACLEAGRAFQEAYTAKIRFVCIYVGGRPPRRAPHLT